MKTTKSISIAMTLALAILFSCNHDNELPIGKEKVSRAKQTVALVKDYTLSTSVGDPIPLETAKRWTANYRRENAGDTEAHFFGNEIIKQILAEEGAVGIRLYYSIDDNGNKQIVLVGTNAKGENLLPSSTSSSRTNETNTNVVADASWPCPGMCPPKPL
jgi:hypothetical protein